MSRPAWARFSLRARLLVLTLLGVAAALLLAHGVLSNLFREEVQRQVAQGLQAQLDLLTTRLEPDAQGQLDLKGQNPADPRWQQPYGGLYWQVDLPQRPAAWRSRSLWDSQLNLPPDQLGSTELHQHLLSGPQGEPLLVLERRVQWPEQGSARLAVAADLRDSHTAVARFERVLGWSLLVLLAVLLLAAWAQVRLGLAPLAELQRALAALRQGQQPRLQGHYPAEVQPLVDDFNGVLAHNEAVLERARTQAGNLAHALKTPLSVLAQAAQAASPSAPGLPELVQEQVAQAQRQVDWHLARARAAAAHSVQRTAVLPQLQALVRTLARLHPDKTLSLPTSPQSQALHFAGETQDLLEMAGNVLDNACRWARQQVRVQASITAQGLLTLCVDDDGPGVPLERRAQVLRRGERLDEAQPGHGLGLAIVQDLAALYGGTLQLQDSPLGGLRVLLTLPSTPGAAGPQNPAQPSGLAQEPGPASR
ncbi:sensor histidine kinase [Roseateles sp. BYS180W]|uniref:histidine kinase n=1 Tax=Roseateles rivi TaxID=3299028 RepID=A0ABW7FTP8_9BURK